MEKQEQKMIQPWMDVTKFWQGMETPFAGPDFFSKWNEMIQETIGKAAGQSKKGLGSDVLSRTMGASNVFVALNEFWLEALKDLPELHRAKRDDIKTRKIFNRWSNGYKKVFEQLVGPPVSGTAQEMMTFWLNTIQKSQAATGLMWNPWFQAIPQWQAHVEKFMKGDWTALSESHSLWREVYDETLGRVFRMPAFGMTKEQTERLKRTYDAYIQFLYSLPNLHQFLYSAGMEALKEAFDKVKKLKFEEMTPESMREVYKIWWTTNEDTFFELFKRPDFSDAMAEALNHGLRLKMRLNDLSTDWCKALPIPSNQEFEEVAKTVHELRRKVRLQQKSIEQLQQKLEKTP